MFQYRWLAVLRAIRRGVQSNFLDSKLVSASFPRGSRWSVRDSHGCVGWGCLWYEAGEVSRVRASPSSLYVRVCAG